jgi:putative ABC transport system permease protein
MVFIQTLKIAFSGLRANKVRSGLTILGIIIGITAIMLVMSLGKGAQDLILSQIQTIGSKTIAIVPGRQPKGIVSSLATMYSDSLKQKDLIELQKKTNVPHLAKLMPVIFGGVAAVYQNESYKATIFGVSDLFAKIYDLKLTQGSLFGDEEIKSRANVVLIGSKVKEELFGSFESVIGQKIKIKSRGFKVIGVLAQKGQSSFFNFDEVVVVPYTTAQEYIFGIKYFHRLVVEADAEENVAKTVADIKATLRNSHNITDPEKDDFFIETQADMIKIVSTVTDILTLFLTAMAAISLLVGGVGIMNIMLVSVRERTREIGLRKALGATEGDILSQFLFEAIILTVVGGLIGILLGTSFSFLISTILSKVLGINWLFSFPYFGAFLGILVATLIGLIFGLYPARDASRKSPIEALRYE